MAGASAKEIQHMLTQAWMIPGLYGKEEAKFLYRLARRRGNLVEIGCWQGRTTIILALAAKAWKAELTTIDPFGKEHMPARYEKQEATPERWAANLRKAEIDPPELLLMTSTQALKYYDGEIALLFLDGNHSYRQVRADLRNWTPRVKIGGYVVLHDMFFPSIPGVARAVVDWWDGKEWRLIGQRQWTIAFRRMK